MKPGLLIGPRPSPPLISFLCVLNLFRWGKRFPILRLHKAYKPQIHNPAGQQLASPLETPQRTVHTLYGRLGGTTRLDGRSKRQFHLWNHVWSPTTSLEADGRSFLYALWGARLLTTPHSHPHPLGLPLPVSILIWQRAGMGAIAEGSEWWKSGIKGGQAAVGTVAGSAAALVGSFSPRRRQNT